MILILFLSPLVWFLLGFIGFFIYKFYFRKYYYQDSLTEDIYVVYLGLFLFIFALVDIYCDRH